VAGHNITQINDASAQPIALEQQLQPQQLQQQQQQQLLPGMLSSPSFGAFPPGVGVAPNLWSAQNLTEQPMQNSWITPGISTPSFPMQFAQPSAQLTQPTTPAQLQQLQLQLLQQQQLQLQLQLQQQAAQSSQASVTRPPLDIQYQISLLQQQFVFALLCCVIKR
jgi:hypothetical protein